MSHELNVRRVSIEVGVIYIIWATRTVVTRGYEGLPSLACYHHYRDRQGILICQVMY